MAFKIKVSFFQNPEKNEDMKLKERLVAATFGFSVAIILVFLVESLDLTDNQDYGQDQSHGIIKSSAGPKSSSVKVLFYNCIHFKICNKKDGIYLQYTYTYTAVCFKYRSLSNEEIFKRPTRVDTVNNSNSSILHRWKPDSLMDFMKHRWEKKHKSAKKKFPYENKVDRVMRAVLKSLAWCRFFRCLGH